jgi:acyl-coenzyme A thioesterase PaaI-like protein
VVDIQALLATWEQKFGPHLDGAVLPAHHGHCLGCGPDNPHGHHLRVSRRGERVVADHAFDGRHEGAPGIVHGGAVATVFDDLFGFLLYLSGEPAVTRQLSVEYLSPALIGTPYSLEAAMTGREGRRLFVAASLAGPDGASVATSTATFVAVGVDHFHRGITRSVDD